MLSTQRGTRRRRGFSRVGALPCLGAFLLLVTASKVAAQGGAAVDTLSGRVIASDSAPIRSARVSVTGDGGRTSNTRTDSTGRYLLTVPSGGDQYLIIAAAFGYAPLAVEVERPAGVRRVVRDLRLNPRVVLLDTLKVGAMVIGIQEPRKTPGEESAHWSSLLSEDLPLEPGSLADVAAFQPGVLRLGDAALSIAGQPPSQNHTTVDGATYGGASLPAEGVRSIAVVTNSYDPARGQFSGGEIAARTISGTNLWGGALSARLEDPNLQYGSLPGDAFGQRDRRARLSGGGGGALLRDRLFIYGAVDLARSAGPQSFLNLLDSSGLRRLQLAPDSARRFAEIVQSLGLQPGDDNAREDTRRDFGSALMRLDYTVSRRHSLTGRLDWRGSSFSGLGASPFRLSGTDGAHRSTDTGALAQLTSGWGFWANELRAYYSAGEATSAGQPILPAGKVQIASVLNDGAAGFSSLSFGGVPYVLPENEHGLWEVADELIRETGDGAHRFKLGVLLQQERFSVRGGQNRDGTFVFDRLSDLELGRPTLFTRTLAGEQPQAVSHYGALYAADTWQVGDALSVIGGLRLEGSRYPGRFTLAPAVSSFSEGRSGNIPADYLVSPRLGFTYDVPGPGNVSVLGGIGRFRGTVPLPELAAVWGETGGELAARLVCVGPAAPVPDWRAYEADPAAIPSTCADGSSTFADRSPAATLFAPGFAAPRSWRASLEVGGNLTDRIFYQADGLLSRGTKLPTALDRNLAASPASTLPEEGGRAIYVDPSGIDPSSGGVAPDAARRSSAVGALREIGARGESRTGQITARVNGIIGKRTLVGVSYTLTRSRDRAGGIPAPGGSLASTAGDPTSLEWSVSNWEQRHAFQFLVSGRPSPRIRLSAIGNFASGIPFTPLVAGDVNGDGYDNDRAFIFATGATKDSAVTRGMTRLLESAPEPARDCLRRQLGQIAARNSCRTPWTPSLDIRAEIRPFGPLTSRHLALSLTASNVTAGLDYLLHGADGLRGWGQYPLADATLLRLRGFDPEAQAFRYNVNPRFGAALGGGLFRNPFKLTLEGRITVGADPRYQPMARVVSSILQSTGTPAKIRSKLAERVRNLPAVVLGLNIAEPGVLGITPAQAKRLQRGADSLAPQLDAALNALSTALAERGPMTAARRAVIQARSREAQALVHAGLEIARQTLTPEQWAKLPRYVTDQSTAEELESTTLEATIPSGGL